MNKREILRKSSTASSEKRVDDLTVKIEALRQSKEQSVRELTLMLEPLAQKFASVSEQTRQISTEILEGHRLQAEELNRQINALAQSLREATADTVTAAENICRLGAQLRWRQYALSLATGLLAAVLVSTLWLWRAPPVIRNNFLDTKAIARLLKPAIIATLRSSKGY
jgi:hypothetical protein